MTEEVAASVTGAQALGLSLNLDELLFDRTGAMKRVKATYTTASGSSIVTPAYVSSNTSVVYIYKDGWTRSNGAGKAVIVARYLGAVDTIQVQVGAVQTVTFRLKTDTATLPAAGATVDLLAEALDARGVAIVNPLATWTSLDPAVATVRGSDAEATVTAVSNGGARIVAQRGTMADTAHIWVGPKPAGLTLEPGELLYDRTGAMKRVIGTFEDASGSSIVQPTYTSSNTSVVYVYRDGWTKATGNGNAVIVGHYMGTADTIPVRVGGVQTAIFHITNDVDSIAAAGGKVKLKAEALDARGVAIVNPLVAWKSLTPQVATVSGSDAEATVTGVANGVARIVATRGVFTDTATVTVGGGVVLPNPPVASSVVVTPASDTITLGATAQLAASVLDAQKTVIPGQTVAWTTLDPAVASVSANGVVTPAATGTARIKVSCGTLSAVAQVVVEQPQSGGSGLPGGVFVPMAASLKPTAGPLSARPASQQQPISGFDARYAAAELATYNAWVAGGRSGTDASSHYGALRSRYQWSIRNGLPVGPSAPATSAYRHGVEMTRAYLTKYSVPNSFKVAPHNNTAMADVEMLYVLENDQDALAHLKAVARFYGALYGEHYFNLTGPNSDPRSSAILLQTLNAAVRHGFPYTGRASWGSSWKQAAAYMVAQMDAKIPASGKVISLAHLNTGQGEEAFFMNAMLATELLRWHGFVEPQPTWFALAKRIMDHLVDEHNRRGAACLPYLAKGTGCASDLPGFYVWPALVLWQETGDPKYRQFALDNIQAAQKAFIAQTKIFNQAYSTGAQSAEALLAGVSWR